ncbi:MAG TPA: FtsX-like permease family protein, partial [Methanomassiliicoccales archaeon]|nr:FtsX-like permease family protein [Methanomassiliicoccales archaeon]
MTRLGTAIVSLILAALFIVALLTLSVPDALLIGIGLVVVFVLLDARRNRVLFLMGRRNILRRKGTTVLVVFGLMVGTAIISASFVVGDTLDNMIIGETTKGSAGVDFVIESPGEQGTRLFNDSVITSLESDLTGIDNIQFVQSFVESSAAVLDNETQLSNAGVRFMGLTSGLISSYRLIDQGGEPISSVPVEGEAYINEKLATELDAAVGHHLTLFTGNISLNLVVQRIAKYEQLGSFDLEPHVYLDLTTAQNLTGYPDHKNILFVSLVSHQSSDIDKAREDINMTLQAYQAEGLKITEDKQQSIEDGLENMATYTSLFFMLGSFSVIAGIVLIANIFTMLGEERKSEMGISRAIGMKRSHLIRIFTYEGMLYAAMAAGIGTLAG